MATPPTCFLAAAELYKDAIPIMETRVPGDTLSTRFRSTTTMMLRGISPVGTTSGLSYRVDGVCTRGPESGSGWLRVVTIQHGRHRVYLKRGTNVPYRCTGSTILTCLERHVSAGRRRGPTHSCKARGGPTRASKPRWKKAIIPILQPSYASQTSIFVNIDHRHKTVKLCPCRRA